MDYTILNLMTKISTKDPYAYSGNPLTNSNPSNVTTNKNTTFYKACHAFHIINVNRFRTEKLLWQFNINDPHLVEIPSSEAVDVDTLNEFYLAEKLFSKIK